ncbi:hypothetical protein [Lysinibacillus agricola]|uniref:hypothetical protein n=1 Tax=Lysinibacillus agricola TaxID=2590012 RepID=UPI003C1E6741
MGKRVYWTEKDVDFLKENYNKLSISKLAEHLGMNELQISRKANRLKLLKDKSQYNIRIWDEEETKILIDNYSELSVKELMKMLPDDLTEHQIRNKVTKLGLKKEKKWSDESVNFLIDNHKTETIDELMKAEELKGFSREAVSSKMSKLGISAKRQSNWSKEEDDILHQYYTIKTNNEMKKLLPQYSVSQIKNRAYRLGLKKDNLIVYKALSGNGYTTKWNDEELKLIIEHYNKIPVSEIQKNYLPDRTIDAIKKKANGLGINKIRNDRHQWVLYDVEENENENGKDKLSVTFFYRKEEIEC